MIGTFLTRMTGRFASLGRRPAGLALLVAGAGVIGVLLGVGIGVILGMTQGKDREANGVPYAASREAFSEFEPAHPQREARRAGLPRVEITPGLDIVVPRLPSSGAVPPPLTGPAPGAVKGGTVKGGAVEAGAGTDAPPDAASLPAPTAYGDAPVVVEPLPSPAGAQGQVAALPGRPFSQAQALPPWQANAARVTLVPELPRIGIVIDDLGLDRKRTERAMGLPAPVTLAFLPYGRRLVAETGRARASGHEILVHVPMEPEGRGADPGPNALLAGLPAGELRARLDWALTRFPGFVGINNHMGSKFTSDAAGMDVVAAELKARGLLFLDSRTAATAVAFERAQAAGVPSATRQVFLDRDPSRAAIDGELKRLEALARKYGAAIAIGHPHDATLDALDAWLPTLAAKGLQLAPVSALVASGTPVSAAR